MEHSHPITLPQRFAAWLVHAFTASGAFVGLMALWAIHQNDLITSFWFMAVAIVIDAVDGLFARTLQVKVAAPRINGELLDNIVDFINYTIVPCFFLLTTSLLPEMWRIPCVVAITFSSAYQFCQVDAKTSDHFFKGFPSYWNIAVFYLFFWQMNSNINVGILLVFAILSFVPIKYVYPSRLDFLSENKSLCISMLLATIIWGAATIGLLWIYPKSNLILVLLCMGYLLLYFGVSFYRTWVPLLLEKHRLSSQGEELSLSTE